MRCASGGEVDIQRRVDVDGQRYRYSGVYRCSALWSCPVCGTRIMRRRSEEIATAAARWGRAIPMVTLTMPHTRDDDPTDLGNELGRAFRKLKQDKIWREKVVPRFGYWAEPGDPGEANRKHPGYKIDSIKTLELTWGASNGAHPHLHVALFTGVDSVDRAELERLLDRAWRRAVYKVCGREPSTAHGCRVTVPDREDATAKIASYLTTGCWGVGAELEGVNAKAAREGRYTPRDLLARYADALEASDVGAQRYWGDVWDELRRANEGRAQTTWSPGLREKTRVRQVDDEVAAEGATPVEVETIAVLGPRAYDQIVLEGAETEVLRIAEREGYDGVRAWLARRGLDCGVESPPWLEYMSPEMARARAGP